LLEKSRITSQSTNERNYHVFYQLCAGAEDSEKSKWHLKSASQFNYLKKSTTIEGVDDAEEFYNLKVSFTVVVVVVIVIIINVLIIYLLIFFKNKNQNAMECLNFSDEQQDTIFSLLSAILNIGDIDFQAPKDSNSPVTFVQPESTF